MFDQACLFLEMEKSVNVKESNNTQSARLWTKNEDYKLWKDGIHCMTFVPMQHAFKYDPQKGIRCVNATKRDPHKNLDQQFFLSLVVCDFLLNFILALTASDKNKQINQTKKN